MLFCTDFARDGHVLEALLHPFVGERIIEPDVDRTCWRYVLGALSFAMERKNGDYDVDGHECDERKRYDPHSDVLKIDMLEDSFDAWHDDAHPCKPKRSPHHTEEEVRSSADRTEGSRIIPGDGMPEHLHHETREIFHG